MSEGGRGHEVVIVPIVPKASQREALLTAAKKIEAVLSEGGIRVILDDNESKSPGWRYNFWEMKVMCLSHSFLKFV